MSKRFLLILAIIAAIFIGFVVFSSDKDKAKDASVSPTSHVKGNLESKVTFLEYGDFECPVCASYYPIVQQVAEKYKDKIKFQFRNLPLTQIHQNAFAAARAAEAASNQGKFWEMYDQLFLNHQSWTSTQSPAPLFEQYAATIGLNIATYKTDFASDKVRRTINADTAEFEKTGNSMGTPAFFVNGKKIELKSLLGSDGRPSSDKFSEYIDAALKEKGQN